MKFSSSIAISLGAAFVDASPAPAPAGDASGSCPRVWTQVSSSLTAIFRQADGRCTDLARAAVRASFHDCGTWTSKEGQTGGCDGSLILSATENARSQNQGLQQISQTLRALATQYNVGVADMIAFAGSHATVTCPLGPTVKTFVGRKDSSNAAPDENSLPASSNLTAGEIIPIMADKGFSAADTVALVGAHSASKQFFVDPARAGTPQDTTPGVWDVAFYSQTYSRPRNVFVFNSDASLATDPRSSGAFKGFINEQDDWNRAFADTFARLIMLGVPTAGMVDCTSALPRPVDNFPNANSGTAGVAPTPDAGSDTSVRPIPTTAVQGDPQQSRTRPNNRPTDRPNGAGRDPAQGQGQGQNQNGKRAKFHKK